MSKHDSSDLFTVTDVAKATGTNRTEIVGVLKGLSIPIRRLGHSIVINHSEFERVKVALKNSARQTA